MYICYGIHRMLGMLSGAKKNLPHAILIRSIQPVEGQEMDVGKKVYEIDSSEFMLWPGNLSVALGFGMDLNGLKFGINPLENCKRSPK